MATPTEFGRTSTAARTRSRAPWALLVIAVAALIAGGLFLASTLLGGENDAAGQAAQSYARSTTVWSSGPTVRSVRVLPLRELRSALRTAVDPRVAADVNAEDLIHRFGAGRRVALVVLTGVHNSLPPDEGVNVRGDVVAIVDTHGNKVLLLTD